MPQGASRESRLAASVLERDHDPQPGAPLRSRENLQRLEDPADRGRADPVAEREQFALDPLVSPAVVLGGESRYELRVHPGTYLIRAAAKGPFSPESSRTVTVAAGETLTVRFLLDIAISVSRGSPSLPSAR